GGVGGSRRLPQNAGNNPFGGGSAGALRSVVSPLQIGWRCVAGVPGRVFSADADQSTRAQCSQALLGQRWALNGTALPYNARLWMPACPLCSVSSIWVGFPMSEHALLLVNLGSPASTEVADVRRYLNQFLMDPYVI